MSEVTQAVGRFLRWVGLLALVGYALGCGTLYWLQRDLLFPGRHHRVGARPVLRDMEVLRVETSRGGTEAWYLPPLDGSGKFPAVIFAHGNGEVIDMWAGRLDAFRRWGMAVMLVEYPGYGRSDGSPSERSVREAMVCAYDILVSRPGVDADRIVGYGHSLGGGAVCALAAERRLAALVLQSTFTSIRSLARHYLMPPFLVSDPFDNARVVAAFAGPVLVLHGRHDGTVSFGEGEVLARLAQRGELRVYDCGHVCPMPEGSPLLEDIGAFLRANGLRPSGASRAPLSGT